MLASKMAAPSSQCATTDTTLRFGIYGNITAATCRDGVFHSGPTIPTVCDSVSWVVEVSKGYQLVHIYVCTNEGLL